MTQLLFSYGTLQDAGIQRMLFGRTFVGSRAELPGWSLHVAAEGYLFIKPDPAGRVSGSLLALDPFALRAADRWEDAPRLYQREKVRVRTEEGWQAVWAYTRRSAAGLPQSDKRLSLLDQQAVLAAAKLSSVC